MQLDNTHDNVRILGQEAPQWLHAGTHPQPVVQGADRLTNKMSSWHICGVIFAPLRYTYVVLRDAPRGMSQDLGSETPPPDAVVRCGAGDLHCTV
jgi:hypothetical protein